MARGTIHGMTGFGRAQGQAEWGAWTWETRSVNGRGLDLRLSSPPGFDAVEFEARKRVKDRFQRGSFQIQLRVELTRDPGATQVDARDMARLSRMARLWRTTPPTLEGMLAASGGRNSRSVFSPDDDAAKALLAGLDAALSALECQRAEEGAALTRVLLGVLNEMETQLGEAARHAGGQPELVRERFRQRMAELDKEGSVDSDRATQEIVLLAGKADVREELDRLTAHIASARGILAKAEASGRKLDFLCQEFNREANTLCSKSVSLELTSAGLALKSLIEQFREQAQNVE